jgi:hypothetical protein
MDKFRDDAFLTVLAGRKIYLTDIMNLKYGLDLSLDHIEACLECLLEKHLSASYIPTKALEVGFHPASQKQYFKTKLTMLLLPNYNLAVVLNFNNRLKNM